MSFPLPTPAEDLPEPPVLPQVVLDRTAEQWQATLVRVNHELKLVNTAAQSNRGNAAHLAAIYANALEFLQNLLNGELVQ